MQQQMLVGQEAGTQQPISLVVELVTFKGSQFWPMRSWEHEAEAAWD